MTKAEIISDIFKMLEIKDGSKYFDHLNDQTSRYLAKLKNVIKLLPE